MEKTWHDEFVQAIKSQAEREAEPQARKRKRVEEALKVAEKALDGARDAMSFAVDKLGEKQQTAELDERAGGYQVSFGGVSLLVTLDRETAVLRSVYDEGKPREFEFAKDRHLAPKDVEDYVGRRLLELARAAYKAEPW